MNDSIPPVFTARMVGELKGAPLACLILLALSNQPVSNEWLCMMSGYTDKPVASALKKLSSPEFQLVRRAFGGWVISDGFQLPILSDNSRKNSDSTTTTILTNKNLDDQNLLVVVAGRKNSDSPNYDANLQMCRRVGIGEPSASEISNMEHVTPEFIQAHISDLMPGQTRGLAIVRIRNNELPMSWEREAKEAAGQAASQGRYSLDSFWLKDEDEDE